MKICRVKIKGTDLLMHNRQLADPLNEWTKAKAKVTSKKKKTEDDHMEIARLEFMGGLYLDDAGDFIIPDKNIKAMLGEAAKTFKQGKACKEGVTVMNPSKLAYDGPKSAEQRFKSRCYRREPLKQGMAVIVRTRPQFRNWDAELEIYYDESLVDPETLNQWLDTAARLKGIGDGRPNFGRFDIVETNHMEMTDVA